MSDYPRPPSPPECIRCGGVFQCREIPSIPDLEEYLRRCYDYLAFFPPGYLGEYIVWVTVDRAEQALLDAKWWLACESWRWAKDKEMAVDIGGDDLYWEVVGRALAVWRWKRVMSPLGHRGGKSLELRRPSAVER